MTHDDFVTLFSAYWWLIFPIMWMLFWFYSASLHYQHRREKLEVLRAYAQQGKDIPPEVGKAMSNGSPPWAGWDADKWADRMSRYSPYRERRRVVLFAAIAAGFAYAYYASPTHNEAFGVVAVIMGALSVGYLLITLTIPPPDAK